MPISIPQFLLESSICLALFYTFYHFLLRRETFFQLNRAYLLLMPLLSLLIPLVDIGLAANAPSSTMEAIYPIVLQAQQFQQLAWEQMESPTPAFSLSLADLLLWVYLLGAGFMSLTLGRGLWRLFRLIRRSRREQEGELTLLRPEEDIPAASFFSYIFWKGEEIPESKRIILEHELVHVRQRHSLDVLVMELWVVIKWFNPLIYLYRHSLQATHEYIADRYVARQMGSAYQYATFLASHGLQGSCHPLANTFASYLRKRLSMLGQRESSWWRAGKYLLCLPLLGALAALFSFNLSDQLPADGLRRTDEFLQELGASTILKFPEQEPKEPPQFLKWGGQSINLLWVNSPDQSETAFLPKTELSFSAFQELSKAVPELWKGQSVSPLQFLALAVEKDGEALYTCEEKSPGELSCLGSTAGKARPGEYLTLVLKDVRGDVFATRIALVQGEQRPGSAGLSAFSRRKWEEYSRRVVVEARTPKPLFRHSGRVLKWGSAEAFFLRREPPEPEKAVITVSLEEFKQMLGEDIFLFDGTHPRQLNQFWAVQMYQPDKKEWETLMFDPVEKGNGKNPYRLSPLQREAVRAHLDKGFRMAGFSILYDEQEEVQPRSLLLEVWIGRNPPEERPLFEEEGVALDPAGVYPYQYINRPGQRSLIKIDTTVERYRWMYDDYKDGGTVEVMHIPGFRTVRRAVTLADVILPEPEVGRVELLTKYPVNLESLSEYHDFPGSKVYLAWRGAAGAADDHAISLSEFQNAAETGLELRVGNTLIPIRQVELLFVPEAGPAARFITDSADRPEVQRAIGKLQARSSVFVTNMVVEGEQGKLLLFPLTFAFNLR